MKHVAIGFLLSISPLYLTAMISDVPNVTNWQKICEDAQKKQQLMTVYKDFCQKRVKENIAWTVGSLTPFIFKPVRKYYEVQVFLMLFALRQTYLLGRNGYRNFLVEQEDLSYLNHDVLEQLGNPIVDSDGSTVRGHCQKVCYMNSFGFYRRANTLIDGPSDYFSLQDINGIQRALSGSEHVKEVQLSWKAENTR